MFSDKSIIITDSSRKKGLLIILNAHKNDILSIDYYKSYNMIISFSGDLSIKLFNNTGHQ